MYIYHFLHNFMLVSMFMLSITDNYLVCKLILNTKILYS